MPLSSIEKERVLRELDSMQSELDMWHRRTNLEIQATHQSLASQLLALADTLRSTLSPEGRRESLVQSTPVRGGAAMGVDDTPTASPPSRSSIPINYNLLFQELDNESATASAQKETKFNLQASAPAFVPGGANGDAAAANNNPMTTVTAKNGLVISHGPGGRPTVQRGGDKAADGDKNNAVAVAMPCQVLVEFKRKRILQFEADHYVSPGEYVAVGGDRGEDVGLVIYSWQDSVAGMAGQGVDVAQFSKWVCMGLGKVIRGANPLEVSQLHGVQMELERRAIEVAQQKVIEHHLPMSIVDAEYQFDRKKLTFYYEAQQRLDFRDLVRDLYKAFRARIWMEMVEPTSA